jgi:hypothetical protein
LRNVSTLTKCFIVNGRRKTVFSKLQGPPGADSTRKGDKGPPGDYGVPGFPGNNNVVTSRPKIKSVQQRQFEFQLFY